MEQKITALRIQKRNPNRANVYLDGEFAFGLAKIIAATLRIGQTLSPEQIRALQSKDAYEEALQGAFHFLSYRPRSEEEIVQNLQKRDIPEATITQVLDRLRELGYIDDARFAQSWVDNRSEFRPRGARALRQELRQKGLPEETIAQTLADLDEDELALAAARKKAPRYALLDAQAFKQKMYGFLSRRGFGHASIREAVTQVWAETQANQRNLTEKEE